MPVSREHKTVQAPILKYAQEIGWTYIQRAEAEGRRGFGSAGAVPEERARKSSLFFGDLLHTQIRAFNPKYKEAEGVSRIVNAEGEIIDQATDDVLVGKPVRKVQPGYPTQAVVGRIQGTVTIEAMVSESGDIDSIDNVSGPWTLINASAEAARKWRFTSTTIRGIPVKALARITFKYDLGER